MLNKIGLFLALALSSFSGHALAEQRIALIVGNADYETPSWVLQNPENDARVVSAHLRDLGFDATVVINAGEDALEDAVLDFRVRLRDAGPDATGLFYFSGHGVQADGINWLVPVDFQGNTHEELMSDSVRLSDVLSAMDAAGNTTNFVIIDACRDDPLPRVTRGGDRGLARVSRRPGMVISYAAAPGQTALDGIGSDLSPFSKAFTELVSKPFHAGELFPLIAGRVEELTGGRQQPWVEIGLAPRSPADFFYFNRQGALSQNTDGGDTDHLSRELAAKVERINDLEQRFAKSEVERSSLEEKADIHATPFRPDETWKQVQSVDAQADGGCYTQDKTVGPYFQCEMYDVAYDPTGARLASAVGNGDLMVWPINADGKIFGAPARLEGTKGLSSVSWSSSGMQLAATRHPFDKALLVWEFRQNGIANPTPRILETGTAYGDLAWSQDDRFLAAEGYDNTVVIINISTGQKSRFSLEGCGPMKLSWSPQDTALAVMCGWDVRLFVAARDTFASGPVLDTDDRLGMSVWWSADGSYLTHLSGDYVETTWALDKHLSPIGDAFVRGEAGWVDSGETSIDPFKRRVATATTTSLKMSGLYNGDWIDIAVPGLDQNVEELKALMSGSAKQPTGLAWHPNGTTVAVSTRGGKITLWQLDGRGSVGRASNTSINTELGLGAYQNQEFAKALKYWLGACEAGGRLACFGIGVMYAEGQGVDQNKTRAFQYFTTSCDLNYYDGCYNAGNSYRNGEGIDADLHRAVALWVKACNSGQGNTGACNAAAWRMAVSGDSSLRAPVQALELALHAVAAAPNDANVLDTLAAAHAANGKFSEAVRQQEKAIAAGGTDESFTTRLNLYRSGQGYTE